MKPTLEPPAVESMSRSGTRSVAQQARKTKKAASDVAKRIGSRLRELRTGGSKPSSQGDLARRAHVSPSFLSMIERGERVAYLETLEQLSQALGVPMRAFFEACPARDADEPFQPLIDFVRRQGLTSGDVERLLGAARSMFRSEEE